MNDLISIITPAYRAESCIAQTIESVLQQTYQNWELLITDDCSPDDTCSVVEQYALKDPRIRLIRQRENGGPAAARNSSIAAAHGDWLAFLDSDDLWLPQKLEKQLNFHKQVNAALTFTEFRRISADGSKTGSLIRIPGRLTYSRLLGNTAIATSTVLVNRKLVGEVRMKKTYYDDFACWLGVLRGGGEARGLQDDLMRYRVMENSVSRNKWKSSKEVWKLYRSVENLSVVKSLYYFLLYATNGFFKYSKF